MLVFRQFMAVLWDMAITMVIIKPILCLDFIKGQSALGLGLGLHYS